ncbi:MAG TPA: ester cyclase [Chryseosolibacter sp.]|nr:ester cyclase [Chryseosolibacter sp.]
MKIKYFAGLAAGLFLALAPYSSIHSTIMQSNTNADLVKKFYATLNQGKTSDLDPFVAADFRDYNASPDQPKGLAGFKSFLQNIVTAYPDLSIEVLDVITENNKVVARLQITGTHSGVLMGKIQPTNKRVQWTGIDIFEINGGKITGRWSERNLLSMMIQVGAFPK